MPRGYRQSKRDANHMDIVRHARSLGMSVLETHAIAGVGRGKQAGALDLLIGHMGIDQRVEIKDGSKTPSERRLTDAESETFYTWKGRRPVIIESIDDVNTLHDILTRASLD